MRKTAIALLSLVLFAVALVAVRGRVTTAIETRIDRLAARAGIAVGREAVRLSLLPRPAVVFENLDVRARGVKKPSLLSGGRLRIVPRLFPLIFGEKGISSVEFEDVRFGVRLERADSAIGLLAAATGAEVPIVVERSRVVVFGDDGEQLVDAPVRRFRFDTQPREEGFAFDGEIALLGAGSRARITGLWQPGVGPTGGDALTVRVRLRDGEARALADIVPPLAEAPLAHGISLDLEAQGFVGERSTESVPAEPLAGRIRVKAPVTLFGVQRTAVFRAELRIDDRRYTVADGEGKWGERPFAFAGWLGRGSGKNRIGIRVDVARLQLGDVLDEFGVAERWRTQGEIMGQVRVTGSLLEPLVRYEAEIWSARVDAFPPLTLSFEHGTVTGSLAAPNADATGSFRVSGARLGGVELGEAGFGAKWSKDRLTVTSFHGPHWNGKADFSLRYPARDGDHLEGGFVFHDVDAQAALSSLFPGLRLRVSGRLDAFVQLQLANERLSWAGRVGLHDGDVESVNIVRDVVERVLASTGSRLDDDLTAAFADTIGSARLPVRRLAADFVSTGEGTDAFIDALVTDEATVVFRGSLDQQRRLAGDGVATLGKELTTALFARAPACGRLADTGGRLHVPVRLSGPLERPGIALDTTFLAALEKARAGNTLEPFRPPSPTPIELDMPSLEETFAR